MIDRDSWLAMRRLAAAGLVQFAEGQARELYRSPGFAETAPSAADPAARAADLARQAGRSVRMASVLAGGGFADEAAPLLAKALALGAGAVLAGRGELPADATMATPDQIRQLVEAGALPPAALSILVALWSGGGTGDDVGRLVEAAGEVISALTV